MKVVIINEHPQDFLGGSEIQSDIIARKLQKFGHQVVYLACNGKGNYNTPYQVIAIKISANIIAQTTINEKPDIVYWRNNKKNGFRKAVKKIRKNGIPVVFAVSSLGDTLKWLGFSIRPVWNLNLQSLFRSLLKNLVSIHQYGGYKWVDGITVNNETHLNDIPMTKQIYVPNSNEVDAVNFEWNKRYIVWVANIKETKQPELCVKLAENLIGSYLDIIMIGNIGSNKYRYFENPDKLPKNLYYLGPKSVEETNGIIQKSICLIHTCKPEGFPGNFIQAWLQGKPVVSYEYDPGGLIESEKLGFVSGKNMDQFIADIKKLIDNPALNQEIGERAKVYADKHFHPETNVRKLENFFFDVLENKEAANEAT